jgi:hypothetical protein
MRYQTSVYLMISIIEIVLSISKQHLEPTMLLSVPMRYQTSVYLMPSSIEIVLSTRFNFKTTS